MPIYLITIAYNLFCTSRFVSRAEKRAFFGGYDIFVLEFSGWDFEQKMSMHV